MKTLIICDIDGTIADNNHRLHHITGEKKDWDSFHKLSRDDERIETTCKMLRGVCGGDEDKIVFLTARSDKYEAITADWLFCNVLQLGVCCEWELVMRKEGDYREHEKVKYELYCQKIEPLVPEYDRVICFEDHPGVQDMWRGMGFDVVCIHNEHYQVNGEIKEE